MKEAITYLFTFIISIFLLAAIVAFSKWRELSQERELRHLVSWSVIGGGGIPLWAEVSNAQIGLNLTKEYRISGDDEWQFVKEILDEYKQDLMKSYFEERLCTLKSKYVIQGEAYFMLTLYTFLLKHQCDYKFLNHDMHKERVAYKSYGSTISSGFDATYSLTEFALVFHKMLYITYGYCIGNNIAREFVPEWQEKNLKEILDTKKIEVSRW